MVPLDITRPVVNRFALVALGALAACTPSPDSRTAPPGPTEAPATSTAPMTSSAPQAVSADAPLADGHTVFEGMVRPTKGGYEVRGVIIDGGDLQKALAAAPGKDPKNSDWFLGAVVRIEGELHKHNAPPPDKDDGIPEQRRSGTWTQARRVDSASIVKPAEVIEGTLARSKGFFTVAGRLVSRDDLEWSLAPNGGKEGERVRL